MNARDLMNHDIVSVTPNTPLREVARTLLTHGISAVPVLSESGAIVGMVSEGDLVGRKKTERETRSEWWLQRLAEGEPLNTEFLEHLQSPLAIAREVMSSPVLSVSEDTSMDAIAGLMAEHKIKRLPVVRDGQLVGIVRRTDLLRTIGGEEFAPVPLPPDPHRAHGEVPGPHQANGAAVLELTRSHTAVDLRKDEELTVGDFRHLVEHHQSLASQAKAAERARATEVRRQNLRHLIDTHISDKGWNGLIHQAREAADLGETEFLLLRFPSQLCSDGGRAINVPDPDWPATLRGEAAELYLRWERELRPRGFHIAARILEFPDGIPGDAGLFLVWGE